MADKQINDWVVAVQWDVTGFNKTAKHIERTLNRLFKLQSKITGQRLPRGMVSQRIQAKENKVVAEQKKKPKRIRFGGDSSAILTGERLLKRRAILLEKIARLERKASNILDKQSGQYKEIAGRAAALRKEISRTVGSNNLAKLSRELANLTQQTNSATRAAQRQTTALRQQSFTTRSLTDSTRNLARSYLSVFAAVEGGRAIIGTATRFDSLDASMLAASGTAKQAALDFEFIKKTSFDMGVGLEAVTDGFRQIGSAQRFSGVSAEESQKQFRQMIKITRSFGLTTDRVKLSLLAFQQMISKGVVSSEELRRQLGENLPGAMAVAATAMGVTGLEFSNMLKRGEVITTEFLPKFLALYEKLVTESGAYDKSLRTIVFAQARLLFQWDLMIKALTEMGGKDILITLFTNLSKIVDNLLPSLALLVSVFGGLAIAITSFIAGFTEVTSILFSGFNMVLDVLGSVLGIVIGPDGLITAFEALGVVVASILALVGAAKIATVIGVMLTGITKLVVVLKQVRAVMAGIAILTGISTGGLSVIAGVAAVGVGVGTAAILGRSSSPALSGTTNNSTANTTNVGGIEINLTVPEGLNTAQAAEDISQAVANRLAVSGSMPN